MKYERLIEFGEVLPDLRRRLSADLRLRGLPREKVVATVVHLLETSLIRVGNESYAKANGSFGLTTLRTRQVQVDGADLHFRFRGKSGQWHEVEVHDRRAAQVVRRCQDLPGLAATALAVLEPPRSDAAARREAAAAIKVVARHLGNTPTVARTSYVHPDVVDLYVDGELERLWAAGPTRDTRWLVVEERKLLHVLRAAHRGQRHAARASAA
jgi:DNA topoisomerase-1